MVQRIFDEFVQERQALDRSRGGLGLGLAIVRSLVLAHGGRVFAESAGRGQGAVFHVWLPRGRRGHGGRRAAGGVAGSRFPGRPPRPGGGRQRRRCRYSRRRARDHGAPDDGGRRRAQRAAGRGRVRSRDRAARRRPAGDGRVRAGAASARAGRPQLQAVALTGYGQEQDRRRSREAGFAAHLVKPISVEMLVSLIASLPRGAPGAKP